jgi:hypothetical protein
MIELLIVLVALMLYMGVGVILHSQVFPVRMLDVGAVFGSFEPMEARTPVMVGNYSVKMKFRLIPSEMRLVREKSARQQDFLTTCDGLVTVIDDAQNIYHYQNSTGGQCFFFVEWSETPSLIASVNQMDPFWYAIQIKSYINMVNASRRDNVELILYRSKEDYFYIFNKFCKPVVS